MTGPGPGKFLVEDANCRIVCKNKIIPLKDAEIYIHLKGYSYARVTHLDIEHPLLDKIIEPGKGYFLKIFNFDEILRISLRDSVNAFLENFNCIAYYIEIRSRIFQGFISRSSHYVVTWVGGKSGGIYIGFKREQIKKLENIVREVYGFEF